MMHNERCTDKAASLIIGMCTPKPALVVVAITAALGGYFYGAGICMGCNHPNAARQCEYWDDNILQCELTTLWSLG